MRRCIIAALTTSLIVMSAGATALDGVISETDQLRQLLLSNPDNLSFDFNGDGKVDIADLVVALNADNSIYLRPDVRFDSMEESKNQWDSFGNLDASARAQAMVQWLETNPLYEEVGISSGEVVWATFTDGLPILFVDNRIQREVIDLDQNTVQPAAWQPGDSMATMQPHSEVDLAAALSLVPGVDPVYFDADLPVGRRVEIINAFGDGWYGPLNETRLRDFFTNNGYTLGPVSQIPRTSRTVNDLKNLSGADVIWIAAHGAHGRFDNAPGISGVTGDYFSISTSDLVEQSELVSLNQMVIDLEIVPVVNSSRNDAQNQPITETFWGITENFVDSYIDFGPTSGPAAGRTSLIYADACHSANTVFQQTCEVKGAAMFMGWTDVVDDQDATIAARHMFGRLLGEDTNTNGANTNVRPFDVDTIFREMDRFGLTTSGNAVMQVIRATDCELAILRPMVHGLVAFPQTERLGIYGMFGSDVGADPVVTIDGRELTVLSRDAWTIECQQPATGSRSIGIVKVDIGGVESNPIPLTEFSGICDFTRRALNPFTEQLEEILNGTFIFRSRVNIFPYRVKPDMDPVWPWVGVTALPQDDPELIKFFLRHGELIAVTPGIFENGGSLSYEFGGAINNGGCEGSVSGSGSIDSYAYDPGGFDPPPDNIYTGICHFFSLPDSDVVNWTLSMTSNGLKGTFTPGGECQELPSEFDDSGTFGNGEGEITVNTQTFEIPAGSYTTENGKTTLSWQSLGPCCDPISGYPQ